ncbi:hypothetical protein PPACK8108_LOCUS14562 [Phakopsora pachyrhizi]|uniref:Uncharacterized protein n=1 Tax=Phakopsora pachyrhizi TaxID=170000 RepID=A0AAV0B8E2_PHAPC|nr:hypothetical protein PPACK8108_LOCUS14562 [Phakopsora pachyrhizi]
MVSRLKSPFQINLANLVENRVEEVPVNQPIHPVKRLSKQSQLLSQPGSEMSNVPSTQGLSEEWSEPSSLGDLTPSEHPESNRSNAPGQSQPEHLPNHKSSSELEIKHKDDDVLGNEELYSAQTHLSPKDENLPISGPLREALSIIVQDSNRDDLVVEPVKLQSSQKNSHQLRAFTISFLKNERNLTVNSSISSSSSSSSSISEAFHQLLLCSSTPVSNILTNGTIGDLTKERDRESAKAQKSGGSKINEMVRIIKEQALKFEEESVSYSAMSRTLLLLATLATSYS